MMKKKTEDFHMQLTIKHPFLCLPVVSHPKDTRVLKLFDGEKLLLCVYFPFGEAAADNGTYSYEYLSPLPVSEWMGRTLKMCIRDSIQQ